MDAHKHQDGKCNDICINCGGPVHPCLPCEEVVMLNGNHTDYEYNRLLELILKEGKHKKNRTGVNTIGVFGAQAKFDVRMDAFPILTTKKVWFKGIVHELLWFIRGETNIKYLVDNDVHIWDEWAYKRYVDICKVNAKGWWDDWMRDNKDGTLSMFTQEEFINHIKENTLYIQGQRFADKWGELGEGTYGGMWRSFPTNVIDYDYPVSDSSPPQYTFKVVDQLQKVLNKLKNNPDDRRIIVSAWHPHWVDHCALPPCHCLFHFNTEELTIEERRAIFKRNHPEVVPLNHVEEKDWLDQLHIPTRRLNCLLYQRSCDTFLGVPFNITSYCLLTAMIAHCVNMVPGVFTHTYGDLHIYENHFEQVKEQLSRTPKLLPKLWLNPKVNNLFDFKFEDIKLENYQSHPTIKAPIAV
jgi:thymidylate synthase